MRTKKKAGNSLPSTSIFRSTEEKKFRHLIIDKEPWFVAKDICDVLEHSNPSMIIKLLDDDEKMKIDPKESLGSISNEKVWIVNESGLYNLIFRSNKSEAKKFRKWVTSEVLPQLRRTGRYSVSKRPRMTEEAKKLRIAVSIRLVIGDNKKVAEKLGLTPKHVSAVRNGRCISHRVMEALCDQAEYNQKNGIQMTIGYSDEFVSSRIQKLIA